jgi:prephenate dehydratase
MKIGILGSVGTYSEKTAKRWCPDAKLKYLRILKEVVIAVEMKKVEARDGS